MSLQKFKKPVCCVSPRATVFDAACEMLAKNVGAIVIVSDDNKPIGLFTDRDVVLRVIAEGRDPRQTTVEDVMTGGVATVGEDESIGRVTEIMRDCSVRRLPIVDREGHVVGIVTSDDVLLLLGAELGNLASAIYGGLAIEAQRQARPAAAEAPPFERPSPAVP